MMPAEAAAVNGPPHSAPRITVFPAQPRGAFGEPWCLLDDGTERSYVETKDFALVKLPTMPLATRTCQCVNSMTGIADPHQLMRDVRFIAPELQRLAQHADDFGFTEHFTQIADRIVAALKLAGAK